MKIGLRPVPAPSGARPGLVAAVGFEPTVSWVWARQARPLLYAAGLPRSAKPSPAEVSNPVPAAYKAAALPDELAGRDQIRTTGMVRSEMSRPGGQSVEKDSETVVTRRMERVPGTTPGRWCRGRMLEYPCEGLRSTSLTCGGTAGCRSERRVVVSLETAPVRHSLPRGREYGLVSNANS